MRIISFINEANVNRRTLAHLGLWHVRPGGKPPPDVQETDGIDCQPFDDGWGECEEPSVTLN